MVEMIESDGQTLTESEKNITVTLHAVAGEVYLRKELGVTDEEISKLYREMIALNSELDSKFLEQACLVSITDYKKIFWFQDRRSYEIFEDVYCNETNALIIEQYNRIFESIAGNNMCISLHDFRGMICRLPYDMSAVAKKGILGMQNF